MKKIKFLWPIALALILSSCNAGTSNNNGDINNSDASTSQTGGNGSGTGTNQSDSGIHNDSGSPASSQGDSGSNDDSGNPVSSQGDSGSSGDSSGMSSSQEDSSSSSDIASSSESSETSSESSSVESSSSEQKEDSSSSEHVHEYVIVVVEPTCTEEGYTIHTCSCGDSYNSDYVAPLDHNYGEYVVDIEATCLAEGHKYALCLDCGNKIEESIPALGHDYIHHEGKEATCDEAGYEAYDTCSRCDYSSYSGLIEPLGHHYGEYIVKTEPTCIDEGIKYKVCSDCGDRIEETIEALGHDYVHHDAKAATCIDSGYNAYETCSRCDYSSFEGEIAPKGHSYGDYIIDLEPTCVNEGRKHKVCADCDDVLEEAIEPLGHSLVHYEAKAATCTEYGYDAYEACSRCDYSTYAGDINPLGHHYGEFIIDKEPTCTEEGHKYKSCTDCDAKIEETIEALGHDIVHHDAKGATCTEIGYSSYDTCSRCDYSTYEGDIAALGHSYGEYVIDVEPTCVSEGTKHRVCSTCSDIDRETIVPLGHDLVNHEAKAATCTESGYAAYNTCSRCDYSTYEGDIAALGHTYGEYVVDVEPTCLSEGHRYKECRDCGDRIEETVEALGHDLIHHEGVEATCTEDGYSSYDTCSRCDYSTTSETTEALGHNYGEYIIDAHPDCENEGHQYKVCRNCNDVVEETLPALGHTYTLGKCTRCGYEHVTEGLAYSLSKDRSYYIVTGKGTATDADIVIPSEYKGIPVKAIDEEAFWRDIITSVTITGNITTIGDYAFLSCSSLKKVEMADSVTTIGYCAFDSCKALESITLSSSLTSIAGSLFSYCYALSEITIPSSVTSIGDSAFSCCTSLKSLEIPSSVTSIGSSIIDSCSSLTSLVVEEGNEAYYSETNCLIDRETSALIAGISTSVIPSGVTSIASSAFSGCKQLTSIEIPDSVTSIGSWAFYFCNSLTSIIIPDGVTLIGNCAFYNCTKLSQVTLGSGLKTMGTYAFERCESLQSITIPSSITQIPNYAFTSCTSLSSVSLPSSLVTIGSYSFYECTSLTSITIPASTMTIYGSAFASCTSLKTAYFKKNQRMAC